MGQTSATFCNFGFEALLNAIRKLLRNFANPSSVVCNEPVQDRGKKIRC